jgi:hypothetical protein
MTEAVSPGSAMPGTLPTMDARQQPLSQNWPVAGWSPEDALELNASSSEWCCADAWFACRWWSVCMSELSWAPIIVELSVRSASGHSMVAVTAPRMGSRMESRTKTIMRRLFP